MKKLAEEAAHAVEDSRDSKRAGALVEGHDPREATSAMLRDLKRLLEEKDKTGAWGGLTRKLTKEGYCLWLCPFHADSTLSIYEAGDGVKRKIATPYLNRHFGSKDGDNKNSHCSLNELEKT